MSKLSLSNTPSVSPHAGGGDENDEDDEPCVVCGCGGHDDQTVLCDGCDQPNHFFCLDPPLKSLPEGDWYCSSCAPSVSADESASGSNTAAIDAAGAEADSPLIRSRATLVVCNVSLVGQWFDECTSKLEADHLSVYRYYGSDRTRDPSVLADHDIVVTTFAILASDFNRMTGDDKSGEKDTTIPSDSGDDDIESAGGGSSGNMKSGAKPKKREKKEKKSTRAFKCLKAGEEANPAAKVHWWRIVLDESHNNVKDLNTFANKACTHLTSGRRWCVSGTPITNKLEDLIGQFRFLHLSPLDSPASFYALSIHSFKLLACLRRILIRHSKSQSIFQLTNNGETGVMTKQSLLPLPPLTTVVEFLDFSADIALAASPSDSNDEASAYAEMERQSKERYLALRGQDERVALHHVSSATLEVTESMLRPLRQVCSGGPMVMLKKRPTTFSSSSSAAAAGAGAAEDLDDDDDNKSSAVVMETKLHALIGWLQKVKSSDPTSKCLVFTQFKQSMTWLSSELPKRGFEFRTLDGTMSQKAREEALLAFQDDPPTTVFLLSVRAGAVGINLTEANHVFLMEPLLNLGLEKQGKW
jgi:SNF2 family DNA or RNA helicase